MNVVDRIAKLQSEHGLNNKSLELATGLRNGCVSSWKKGRYAPSAEAVVKLAKYFHVTTDYLFGLSESREPQSVSSLTPEETRLIYKYRYLDDEGKTIVRGAVVQETRRCYQK